MSAFKNLYKKGSEEQTIIEMINTFIRDGVPACETEHKRCESNARMERGFQWEEGDAAKQLERDRPALPLNSLLKLVNAIANREIMDRIVPRVYGREDSDAGIAEALDEACRWQRDTAETEHEESMAFRKCVASGYGVMHKHWDPLAFDGDGMIIDEEVPLWYMLWDPRARKQDLVDRKWHICGKFVDLDDLKEEYGDISKANRLFVAGRKLGAAFQVSQDGPTRSGGVFSSGTWGQILGNRWASTSSREQFVIEAEWQAIKTYYKVAYPVQFDDLVGLLTDPNYQMEIGIDPTTQEPLYFTAQEFQQMPPDEQSGLINSFLSNTEIRKYTTRKEFEPFMEQYENITGLPFEDFRKEQKRVYKFAIVTDGVVLDHGERPMGFTYEFMTGFPFETREGMQWYGMVDVAKGPQDMKNVFFSNLLTIYMTSPKQHLLVEEGALNDPDQFLDEYAKVSGVSIVPNGFIQSNRFMQLQPPHFPSMTKELIEIAEGAVQETFGLSSIEMNEQGDLRRVSGNVVSAAKQASNTLLAVLFDALRRYRKRWGLMSVRFIMEFYTPEDIARMIGEEAASPLQGVTDWPSIYKFDIKIDESPTSVTEQMRTADFLTRNGTIDNWMGQGFLDFEDAIEFFPDIPKVKRDKIKEKWAAKREEQNQIQQLQGQIDQLSKRQEALFNFIKSQPMGPDIVKAFELLEILAEEKAQELQQQQEQEQAPQQ